MMNGRGNSVAVLIIAAMVASLAGTAMAINDLSLNVDAGTVCVSSGETVTVTLDVTNLSAGINGVQALLSYDNTLLTLVDIVPTDLGLTLPAAGWVEIAQTDVAGSVDYAAVINGGSIIIDHTVATATFTAIADGTTSITFRADSAQFFTKLTVASDSSTILPNKADSGGIFIGPPSCTITTPAAVCDGTSGHAASVADAGVGATYAWVVTGGTLNSGQGTTAISYTAGAGPTVTVDVTVTDANGCSSSCQEIVTVNPNPDCTITAAASVCANSTGNPASVPDAGVGASYVWTVTGGTIGAGQGTASLSFGAGTGPNVTIDVIVTDANGCVSTCQNIISVAAPDCTITAVAAVCDGSTGNAASVTDAGVGTTYAWTVTGGTITSGLGTTAITYTAGAGPTVTIDITVVGGAGCQSSCQDIITVNANPNATITAAGAVCDGTSGNAASVADAGVGATYLWVVTGGTLNSGQGTTAISYTAGAGPTVTIDVTVTDANGCISTSQNIVTVNANPACTITTAAAVCDGSSGNAASVVDLGVGATYAWTVTGGTIDSGQGTTAISYTAVNPTSITIDITVTDGNGCISACNTPVSVNANPNCTITAAAGVCDSSTGNTASVADAGIGATYLWAVTGGTLNLGQGTTGITYTAGVGPTLTVDVTVTDANGCVSSCQSIISVNSNPTCTITGPGAVCDGTSGHTASTSDVGLGATYAWTVTGGTLNTGQNTTSISYTAGAGPSVTLDLTVTDAGGCVSTCQQIVTVNPNPVATIAASGAVCDGSTGNAASVASAGVGATYAWSVTGGTLDSGQNTTSINYTAGAGPTVTIDVTVTDANGCVSSSQNVVTVNANPNATISAAAGVCDGSAGNAASVADAGVGATYAWVVTGGTINSGQLTAAISYTSGAGPTVTIDVTVTDANGCTSTSQNIVTVNANPDATITTAAAVCDGTAGHAASVADAGIGATYAWTVTGGTLDSGQNTTAIGYTAGAGPTVTIDVTVTDANGCVSTSQTVPTVNPLPPCTISTAAAVCADTASHAATVSDAGVGAAYVWTVTGGTLDSGQGTTAISYTSGAGPTLTLDATVTNVNGCVSTCQQIVTVNANPVCTISANNLACAGFSGNIATVPDAGLGATYLWVISGGALNSGQGTTSITYTAGTGTSLTLDVTTTDANGCISSCQKIVTVDAPDCSISGANDVCFQSVGNFATVPDSGVGSTYAWTVTGGSLTSGQGTNSITYAAGAGLTVTLDITATNSNGCTSTCQKIVNIIQPSIDVTLQLEAVGAIVTRDVTFVITQCLGSVDSRTLPVTTDATGLGTITITATDPNAEWISAQEGHTLRQVSAVTYATCSVATVTFTGADTLLAGDFHTGTVAQDNLCDIVDFSILASRWNVPINANLTTGADATGDGVQDTSDFTAIQINFFALGEAVDSCAVGGGAGIDGDGSVKGLETTSFGDAKAKGSVAVANLGIPGAERADLNGDGVVDAKDIRAFAALHSLPLLPDFIRKLDTLERTSVRKGSPGHSPRKSSSR